MKIMYNYIRKYIFRTQKKTALDAWLLLSKTTLFLELIEYAIVLQVKFSNATLTNFGNKKKCKKQKTPEERSLDDVADTLKTAKCRKIDTFAFIGFLFGSIFINIVYFTYYW